MEWISVEDRLPELYHRVLLFISHGEYISIGHYAQGDTWHNDMFDEYVKEPWKVTHWMPLPEPPIENKCIICKADKKRNYRANL